MREWLYRRTIDLMGAVAVALSNPVLFSGFPYRRRYIIILSGLGVSPEKEHTKMMACLALAIITLTFVIRSQRKALFSALAEKPALFHS